MGPQQFYLSSLNSRLSPSSLLAIVWLASISLDHIYQQNSTRVDLSNLFRVYLYKLLQSLLPCRMLLATPSLITTILMLLLTRDNGGVVGALPMDVAGVYGTGILFGGAEHVPYPNPPTRGWARSRIAIFQREYCPSSFPRLSTHIAYCIVADEPVNVYVDHLENGLPTERSRLIVGDYKQPQKHFEYRAHRPSPDSVSLVVDLYNPRKPNIPLLALPHVPDSSQPGEFTHMGQIFLTPNQNSQYLYIKGGGDLLTRIGTREDDTTMVPVLVELSNRGYIQAALRLLFSPAFQDYDSEDIQGQRSIKGPCNIDALQTIFSYRARDYHELVMDYNPRAPGFTQGLAAQGGAAAHDEAAVHGEAEVHDEGGLHGEAGAHPGEVHGEAGAHDEAGVHVHAGAHPGEAGVHPGEAGAHVEAGAHPEEAGPHLEEAGVHGEAGAHTGAVGAHIERGVHLGRSRSTSGSSRST
ncbi:hypothetical protein F5878DRAFT_72830 [Lentinula raphanica]|uniref:Uncharacterized protein n=1 Tax=Lentinula raphanica TaxID=153919 RepID=A0AA38UG86_9AGAR|nr:hypothetical protein F5878DRAFT_72830 [Lentinula raphanica]